MRNKDALIRDVNDGILAVGAAKRELKLRTEELVRQMKEDGHDRAWGVEYMDMVSKSVDETTAKWATQYFNEAWPEEDGDVGPAPDAPDGA